MAAKKNAKPAPAEAPPPKGEMTKKIMKILEKETEGVAINDIAQQVGKNPSNIYVWQSKVGKDLGVVRLGPGILGLEKHGTRPTFQAPRPPAPTNEVPNTAPIINPEWVSRKIKEHLTGPLAEKAKQNLAEAMEERAAKAATPELIHKAILAALEETLGTQSTRRRRGA